MEFCQSGNVGTLKKQKAPSQSDSILQQLPSCDDQFRPLGEHSSVSQSQELKHVVPVEPEKDESSDESDEPEYVIMFGGNKSGQNKPKFFDETGYKVICNIAEKFEPKKSKKKKKKAQAAIP